MFSMPVAADSLQRRAADDDEQQRDDHVHHRPGDGDQEFLPWLFGNALELGDATDRQQCHVGRRHAEIARGEDVTELVQQHAKKQQQQKGDAVQGAGGAFGGVFGEENPGQKQDKGQVDADHRAGDLADIQ